MLPDYVTVLQLLAASQVANSPAEIHGLITGLLCAANPEADPEDTGQLLQPPQQCNELTRKFFSQLATASQEQLSGLEYSFQPLLPSDDSSLSQRVVALGEWCDGFTVGFAAAFFLPESSLSADVKEILADFAQFAGMADAVNDLSDQDEVDYMELVEYVRMAVIMVYQQLADSGAEKSSPDDADTLPDAKFLH